MPLSRDTVARRTLYKVLREVAAGLCTAYWRLEVVGRENLPDSGPYVLAPVHRSNVDFMVVGAAVPQRVRFMAKDSLWRVPLLRTLLTVLGAFPVERGAADREAMRRCLEVLDTGEPLVVFPEGTRREGPEVAELYEGAAYLAVRAQVPLVPVGIGGSGAVMPRGARFIRPVRVAVVIGAPVVPPSREGPRTRRSAVRQMTVGLRDDLQELFDRAQTVVGRPNQVRGDR